MSYSIARLATYEAAGEVVLHGVTEKETQVVGLCLTLAQRDEREWAEEILKEGGASLQQGLATLCHGFLLLWQQVGMPPACSFLPSPTVGEVLVARRVAEWPFGDTWWQARIDEGEIVGRRWDSASGAWQAWGASNPLWRWLDCRPLKLTDDVDAPPHGRCECSACRKLLNLRAPAETGTTILETLRSSLDGVRDAMHIPPPDGIVPSVKALWSDVAWALSYFMQRGVEAPVKEFPDGSILINGVEHPMPKRTSISREDIIRLSNPRLSSELLMSGFNVSYTLGDVIEEPLDEGDIIDAADVVGASFKVTSVPR